MQKDILTGAMVDKLIPIYIPDAEAKQFLVFQERFEIFEAMETSGAFDVMWGKVTLNFANKQLQTMSVEHVHRIKPV